ncbi:MAG TPA: hypothetical protein VI168_07985 [Croceibacterium sp.]
MGTFGKFAAITGVVVVGAVAALQAIGNNVETDFAEMNAVASAAPSEAAAPASDEPSEPFAYSVEACKGAIALMNDRDPTTFDGRKLPDGLVHVTWRSPDDGKRWQARCEMIDNDHLRWAAFDAFGDGQQGRWRSEDTIAVSVENGSLHIDLNQSGVIQKQESYALSGL